MTGTATANELETLMPYLGPPRTPLTPEQVKRAFSYLMALEAGGGAGVGGREEPDPKLPFLMLRLTEDLVLPVITVPNGEDPTADSFILERVGASCCLRCGTGSATHPPPAASAWHAASCASSPVS